MPVSHSDLSVNMVIGGAKRPQTHLFRSSTHRLQKLYLFTESQLRIIFSRKIRSIIHSLLRQTCLKSLKSQGNYSRFGSSDI